MQAQPGIFSLGVPEHCYVELDLLPGSDPAELVRRLAGVSGPETTIAGVSVVIGFEPGLWRRLAPDSAPAEAGPFEPIEGPGVRFAETQHDAWFWVAGGTRDVVFDSTLRILAETEPVASVGSELTGWVYRYERDLTGFIDGTENPPMLEARDAAVAAEGWSILLYQKWRHLGTFRRLTVEEQERVIGRTKDDSTELDDSVMPEDSHVSRNVVEEDGRELKIYRRNVAYGGPTDHGTVFVGFCATQHPLDVMLRRMAGTGDGVRDALTRYTEAVSGAYYVVPSVEALRRFLPEATAAQSS
jgi:putative iron-dependent peroxidase